MFDPYEYIFINAEDGDEVFQHFHTPDGGGVYTSSIISDILGIGYNSRHKRWDMIMCHANDGSRREEQNEWTKKALEHGNLLEPYALQEFTQIFPQFLRIKPGMALLNSKIGACTDSILFDPSTGEYALLEVKSPLSIKQFEIPVEVKPNWIAQVQMEMASWRIYTAFLMIYQPDAEKEEERIYIFKAKFSQQIVDKIVSYVEEFDREFVQKKQEPPKRMNKDQQLVRDLWGCLKRVFITNKA